MDPYQRNEFMQDGESDLQARQQPRKGWSCLSVILIVLGCGLLGCAGVCGGVYYAIFHSSYPLAQIEEIFESSGDIEVEGLSGSISSGFRIDQVRFRNAYETPAELAADSENTEAKWSTLEGIDFKFNGIWELINEKRFIVDQFTVAKGEIYYDSSDDGPTGDAPSPQTDEQGDQPQRATTEDEIFKELRIDLLEISDLKFIDTVTGDESKLGKFAIKDVHYVNGGFQNIGMAEIQDFVARGDEFEVVELSGSTEAGFQVERLAFKGDGKNWSYLNDVQFQFNGLSDLIENQKLVVARFSVSSGEIYTDAIKSSAAFGEENNSYAGADDLTSGNGTKLKQVQIDLLRFTDLKLIGPVSGVEIVINEISVKDLKSEEGHVTGLGPVVIAAEHLEFQEGPSTRFADQPNDAVDRNFRGIIRSAMHESILADIAFDVDVCFQNNGHVMQHASLFNGEMVYRSHSDTQAEVVFQNFTVADYVRWKHGLLPANLSGQLDFTANAENPQKILIAISPGSKFRLRQTPFVVETEQFVLDETADVTPPILASHATQAEQIRCRLYGLKKEPFWAFQLDSDDRRPAQDLYASVLFNKPFEALTTSEKATLENVMQTAESVHPNR